jgi:hypothetical protein
LTPHLTSKPNTNYINTVDDQLRVRAIINSQILGVEAPGWQGVKEQEYQAYSELSQRRQAGCIGAKNVKLFLREP